MQGVGYRQVSRGREELREPPGKRQAESEVEPFKRAKIEPVLVPVREVLGEVALRLRQTPATQKAGLKGAILEQLKAISSTGRFTASLKGKGPC